MLSPAPLIEAPAGEVLLDVKFVEGMKLHCQLWPGRVRCVMRRGATHIDTPLRYSVAQLGFELIVLDPGEPVPELLLDEASLVYVAADDMRHLDLPAAMDGRIGKLVYTVEQCFAGRLAEGFAVSRSLRRRLGLGWWMLKQEGRLRRALRAADGLHFDGYPANRAYRRLNDRALCYLDNRMRAPMIARGSDLEARAEALRRGERLRLVWYGPLEPLSGVRDLLPMARHLRARGMRFELALFGTGPLQDELQTGIRALGLEDQVTLAEPGAFDPVLVPYLRRETDLFISPRRLSGPLSSYVEALGCGLPILGYANRMWAGMLRESGAGWAVRKGHPAALARALLRLDDDREAIIAASSRAVDFARANSFEHVFARRMNDLRAIAGLD